VILANCNVPRHITICQTHLYGLLYLEVARVPERGWLLAAVGLLGKTLGPIGWLTLVLRGRWPASTAVLCVTNDLIWWVPFGIYLYDAWPASRSHLGTAPFSSDK